MGFDRPPIIEGTLPIGAIREDGGGDCRCSATDIARYRARLSGPLADRIDMRVTVAPVALSAMHGGGDETSAQVGARIVAARDRQHARYARVLRVSRTIADLDGVEQVSRDAMAEALGLRGVG